VETFKAATLAIFGIWILVMAFGFYGYGWEGLQAGLDGANYRGHPIDYTMHWLLFLGPPSALAIVGVLELLKRR
jgi:hypothetical protein